MAGSRARACTAQETGCRRHAMWESGAVLEPGLTASTTASQLYNYYLVFCSPSYICCCQCISLDWKRWSSS